MATITQKEQEHRFQLAFSRIEWKMMADSILRRLETDPALTRAKGTHRWLTRLHNDIVNSAKEFDLKGVTGKEEENLQLALRKHIASEDSLYAFKAIEDVYRQFVTEYTVDGDEELARIYSGIADDISGIRNKLEAAKY